MFSLEMDMQPWTMWQIHLKSGGKISLAYIADSFHMLWWMATLPRAQFINHCRGNLRHVFSMVSGVRRSDAFIMCCVTEKCLLTEEMMLKRVKHIIASRAGNGIHTQLMGNAAHIRSIQCIPSNSNQTASFALNLVTLNEDYDQLSWVCPFGIMRYYTT